MTTNGRGCERKRELLEDVLRVMSCANDAGEGEIPSTHNGAGIPERNSRLEKVFAEQERAIIALKKHLEEHGC
jgi:hypothetical protein